MSSNSYNKLGRNDTISMKERYLGNIARLSMYALKLPVYTTCYWQDVRKVLHLALRCLLFFSPLFHPFAPFLLCFAHHWCKFAKFVQFPGLQTEYFKSIRTVWQQKWSIRLRASVLGRNLTRLTLMSGSP